MNPQQNDPTGQNPPVETSYQNQQPYQPQSAPGQEAPRIVYMARPQEPQQQQLSAEMLRRHDESRKQYPFLNLSDGEYVIFAIKRHPIGLVYIWTAVILVVLAMAALTGLFVSGTVSNSLGSSMTSFDSSSISPSVAVIPALLISILAFLFGFIAAYVYGANRFYLTNESAIQHIQTSLFNKREQTISLGNVEDASYHQNGIMEYIFGYGEIRLSTQGDETTYRFSYAGKPQQQIAILNNAVEDFKNIRPVGRD